MVVYMNITLLFGVTNTSSKCLPLPIYVTQIRYLNEADVYINVAVPYSIICITLCITILRLIAELLQLTNSRYSVPQLDNEPGVSLVIAVAILFLLCKAPSSVIRFYQTTVDLLHGHQMFHRGGEIVFLQHVFIQISFSRCVLNCLIYTCLWPAFRTYVTSCWSGHVTERDVTNDALMELETEMDFVSTAVENDSDELIELVETRKMLEENSDFQQDSK